MARAPKKVEQRIKAELRKYQKILEAAKARDLNESDTAIIVSNMLADIFGFDRFADITTEYSIRSTYCDLAVKWGDKIHFIIEVKAIGKDLRDAHLRQAVDYATKEGVDWVILTNALEWEAYRILFQKPIEHEMVFEMNLLEVSPKSADVIEKLYLLTKEGIKKSAIAAYHEEKQATSRFTIGAIILSDPVLTVIRRQLRRASKAARIDKTLLAEIIKNEVLKRDVVESEKSAEATRKVKRSTRKPTIKTKHGGPAYR